MSGSAILVGGFHEMIELAEACGVQIIGILDPKRSGTLRGIRILGDDAAAAEVLRSHPGVPVILSPDLPAVRLRLAEHYRTLGAGFRSLISPRATVSPSAIIGEGSVIQTGVNISAEARLDAFVKVNSHANLMHDVHVGAYTTVAPNAVLLGGVVIGESCYIGAQATLLPGCRVGARSTVGAGAVVTHDVPEQSVVAGVPARPLRSSNP